MAKGIIWSSGLSDHQLQINYITNGAGTGAPIFTKGTFEGQTLTYDFSSDANVTFDSTQNRYGKVTLTDSGVVLTTSRTGYLDTVAFSSKFIQNDTAQDIDVRVVGDVGTAVTVSANTITFIESDGTNVSEYQEYVDEGLLLSPDTGFSSTGARIYPDGTIIGKCTDGSKYIKDSKGNVKIITAYTMAYLAGSQLFYNATLPCTLSSAAFKVSYAIVSDDGNLTATDISDCEFFTIAKTTSSVSVRYTSKSSIFVSGDLAGVDIIIEGEYK